MNNQWTAIDLFCGAGGLSEGFRQAGFHVLVGNDMDDAAAQTFQASHPEAVFLEGTIKKLSAGQFLKAAGLARGELDCLIGGPPCQGFSVYNHQRGMHDERSLLFKDYLRIVGEVMPDWVVLENVTGITSAGGGEAVTSILNCLGDLGYRAEYKILKAEEYGIPQERRRIVFLGNRLGLPIVWPEPTHGDSKLPFVTVADAISDLPTLKNGENFGAMKYPTPAKSEYQKMLRKGSRLVQNHAAPKLGAINMDRIKHIPQGGSWRDIPFDLLPEGMKKARRCDHTKRYGRMTWEGLASTILTKCDIHWGAFIHPDQDRSISVREAARFQSFPDRFEFQGSRTDQFVQVGNAVPPLLGWHIANSVKSAILLDERERKRQFAAA